MKALNDIVEQGWVRYLGACSMPAWEFQMLQNVAEKYGWHKFISMQFITTFCTARRRREMIPYCRATGVGYIPVSSSLPFVPLGPRSFRMLTRRSGLPSSGDARPFVELLNCSHVAS